MSWDLVRKAIASRVLWTGLAVDLAPVLGVVLFGWSPAAVVMLYWIENLIIGAFILPRLVLSGARLGVGGAIGGLLGAGFFALHYALYCALHGTLLLSFLPLLHPAPEVGRGGLNLVDALSYAFAVAPYLVVFIAIMFVWRAWAMVWRFVRNREWTDSEVLEEMFAPYLPILVLHAGLLVGVVVLSLAATPMTGAIILISWRVVWGVWANAPRMPRSFGQPEPKGADVSPEVSA